MARGANGEDVEEDVDDGDLGSRVASRRSFVTSFTNSLVGRFKIVGSRLGDIRADRRGGVHEHFSPWRLAGSVDPNLTMMKLHSMLPFRKAIFLFAVLTATSNALAQQYCSSENTGSDYSVGEYRSCTGLFPLHG